MISDFWEKWVVDKIRCSDDLHCIQNYRLPITHHKNVTSEIPCQRVTERHVTINTYMYILMTKFNPCKSRGKHIQAMDFYNMILPSKFVSYLWNWNCFFVFNFLILVVTSVSLFRAIIILKKKYMSLTGFTPKDSIFRPLKLVQVLDKQKSPLPSQ